MSEQRPVYSTTTYLQFAPTGTRCALCGEPAGDQLRIVEVQQRGRPGWALPETPLCLDAEECLGRVLGYRPRDQQVRLAAMLARGAIAC